MATRLSSFEQIVRRAYRFSQAPDRLIASEHPFDMRNVHPHLPLKARELFDDGHYAQATFEAFKYVDEEVQRISRSSDFGKKLMMSVFGGTSPSLMLNPGKTLSEKNEQEGYKFIFAGGTVGIRNPRGHTTKITDDPDSCLDHLSLASMLLRRLDQAGLR